MRLVMLVVKADSKSLNTLILTADQTLVLLFAISLTIIVGTVDPDRHLDHFPSGGRDF